MTVSIFGMAPARVCNAELSVGGCAFVTPVTDKSVAESGRFGLHYRMPARTKSGPYDAPGSG